MSMLPTNPYVDHIRMTLPASLVVENIHGNTTTAASRYSQSRHPGENGMGSTRKDQQKGIVAFSRCGMVQFPPPMKRKANMMPFILGDINSLPLEYRAYFDMISLCPIKTKYFGKVAYLTIHESFVDAQQTQRRGGLHIEAPGVFKDASECQNAYGQHLAGGSAFFRAGTEHHWGRGIYIKKDEYEGGIYVASNQSGTTEVWDALIDSSVPGIFGKGGGCDHLRPFIGEGTKLGANELVWMTDRTPHEALPQEKSGYRQFFRLVMPDISHWYAEHSTPNNLVKLPTEITVIRHNKFDLPPEPACLATSFARLSINDTTTGRKLRQAK